MFDGYKKQPSTKVVTHLGRNKKTVSKQINFSKETICSVTKEIFLSNPSNKDKLIKMEAQCKVKYAEEDADLDTANIGVKESLDQNTAFIGEDTDLLILFLYSAQCALNINVTFAVTLIKTKEYARFMI